MRQMWIISFWIVITSICTAAINFTLGYTVENWLHKRKNYAAHSQVQLNCCAKSFPNNGDNFGLASDGVPQGYQEQKAIKGAQSRYFELFWAWTKLLLNWRKPENNTLQRWKNTREIITKYKGTRMVKDGEDWHGLRTTKLKSLAKLFKPFNRDWAPLKLAQSEILSRSNRPFLDTEENLTRQYKYLIYIL